MKKLFVLAVLVLLALVFSGCTAALGDMGDCMSKCSELCNFIKQNNFDMGGYGFELKKETNGLTVTCNCSC